MIHSDPVSERAIISTIYRDGFKAVAEITDILNSAGPFTNAINQTLFKVFRTLLDANHNFKLDIPSVISCANEMGFNHFTSDDKWASHLQSIANFPSELENIRAYARKIVKLDIIRRLKNELNSSATDLDRCTGAEKISEVISHTESRILDFSRGLAEEDGLVRLGDYTQDYIEELILSAKPMGVSTGFNHFDTSIGGGSIPNSFDLIGARTKTGKSLLKNAMMLNIAGQGIPVLDVDTEMTREEQIRRLVAKMSGVKERHIRDGIVRDNPTDLAKMRASNVDLSKLPIYHECVAEKNIEQIVATIRRWMLTKVGLETNGNAVKPCVVFLDYLKITQGSDLGGDLKEYQSMGLMATAIKNLMAKYSARCIAFVQLNRDGIDKEDESSIAQSDRLAWFCTSFSILKWLSVEEAASVVKNGKQLFTHKIIPILSRHGGNWKKGNDIYIESQTDICHMAEGPTKDEFDKKQKFGQSV